MQQIVLFALSESKILCFSGVGESMHSYPGTTREDDLVAPGKSLLGTDSPRSVSSLKHLLLVCLAFILSISAAIYFTEKKARLIKPTKTESHAFRS